MTPLLRGDISNLCLPEDLPRLREEAELALQEGVPLKPLYHALACSHPVALGDLVVGPRALEGAVAVREALGELDALEKTIPPGGLYQRLMSLGEGSRDEVLHAAVLRHPRASWVIRLSREAESVPGLAHLDGTLDQPWYGAICRAHAEAGHLDALVAHAARGRVEPALALLDAGRHNEALDTAATTWNNMPDLPLVAHVAAQLGPATDGWLCQLVSRLRSKDAAQALALQSGPFPKTMALVSAILPALR